MTRTTLPGVVGEVREGRDIRVPFLLGRSAGRIRSCRRLDADVRVALADPLGPARRDSISVGIFASGRHVADEPGRQDGQRIAAKAFMEGLRLLSVRIDTRRPDRRDPVLTQREAIVVSCGLLSLHLIPNLPG